MPLPMYTVLEGARAMRRARDPGCIMAYGRVVTMARVQSDGETMMHAQAGIGRYLLARGDAPAALPWYLRAYETVRQHTLDAWRAPSAHDLFRTYRLTGDREHWGRYATEAIEGYGLHHPRRWALVHDLYFFRLQAGELEPEVFSSALVYAAGTPDVMAVRANLLCALGRQKRWRRFRQALVGMEFDGEQAVCNLLEVARGALSLGDERLAGELLERASGMAAQHACDTLSDLIHTEMAKLAAPATGGTQSARPGGTGAGTLH